MLKTAYRSSKTLIDFVSFSKALLKHSLVNDSYVGLLVLRLGLSDLGFSAKKKTALDENHTFE